jgi:phosphopantothenoylcysteine decarboxylase/phosphopantothenate--cysteine ligase
MTNDLSALKGKKILLGISGSIAAYKCAFLTRLLIKAGAEVQVLMTKASTNFITPLTLSTLSKRAVFTEVSSGEGWNNHVEIGLWADAMIVAPATATTLSKMATALCDNMLVASYLSARCPVFFAPAMDLDMWEHPATRNNIAKLLSYGNHLIPVGHGELASGLIGAGRMAEPEAIVDLLANYFSTVEIQYLAGKSVIVTAGPTYEPIDPVRFIGNRSSGKMGVAIAENLANRGANVTLILGPSRLSTSVKGIETIKVETAQQMYEAAIERFPNVDIAVLAAAVADYRPKNIATEKIKKKSDDMALELEKTIDIAASLGKIKTDKQLIVGFALETNNEIANAKGKLKRKNFDFIVLNSLQDKGAGFNHDTNKVTLIDKNDKLQAFELKSKTAVAVDIGNKIREMVNGDS